jgi:U-box domain
MLTLVYVYGFTSTNTTNDKASRARAMFFCAISGEPPQDPVISTKSGHIYERRLVQKYITENGTDPVTGEKLEESDLVSVKASTYVHLLVM